MTENDPSEPSTARRIATTLSAKGRRDFGRLKALPRLLRQRLVRWWKRATLVTLLGAAIGFGLNLWDMQNRVCAVSSPRHMISDSCGAMGLGDRPTRQEREAFASLPEGDCKALDDFLGRYKTGSLAAAATQRRQFQRTLRAATATRFTRQSAIEIYARQDPKPFTGRPAAEASARVLALDDARKLVCAPQPEERILDVTLTSFEPLCTDIAGAGTMCGANYRARCELYGHRQITWCGPGAPH